MTVLRPSEMSEMAYIRATRTRRLTYDRSLHTDAQMERCQQDLIENNGKLFSRILTSDLIHGADQPRGRRRR